MQLLRCGTSKCEHYAPVAFSKVSVSHCSVGESQTTRETQGRLQAGAEQSSGRAHTDFFQRHFNFQKINWLSARKEAVIHLFWFLIVLGGNWRASWRGPIMAAIFALLEALGRILE